MGNNKQRVELRADRAKNSELCIHRQNKLSSCKGVSIFATDLRQMGEKRAIEKEIVTSHARHRPDELRVIISKLYMCPFDKTSSVHINLYPKLATGFRPLGEK